MTPFLRISDTLDADIVPVDCPTCPVNMSCLTGRSGTGWRFECCGTAVLSLGADTVMVDCQINEFKNDRRSRGFNPCPLCSGSIMEVEELEGWPGTNLYLPTVHALIPLAGRLKTLRARHQAAKDGQALAQSIENEEG